MDALESDRLQPISVSYGDQNVITLATKRTNYAA
jgi:hypothetical protein